MRGMTECYTTFRYSLFCVLSFIIDCVIVNLPTKATTKL